MMLVQLLMLAALAEGQSATDKIDANKFSIPRMANNRFPITAQDYPEEAIRKNQQGFVIAYSTVNISGEVERCDIMRSSGSEILDRKTCELITRRTKFIPAIGMNGEPSFGIATSMTGWYSPPREERITYSNMSIELNRLPDNLQSPKRVHLTVAVDENGKPLACRHEANDNQSSLPINTDNPRLIDIGCQQIMAGTLSPARTKEGRAVPSVQGLLVMFTTPAVPD